MLPPPLPCLLHPSHSRLAILALVCLIDWQCLCTARRLILDATFDDLLTLAPRFLPSWLQPIAIALARRQYHLRVGLQASRFVRPLADSSTPVRQVVNFPLNYLYPTSFRGPLLVIRRQYDEMMSDQGDLATSESTTLAIRLMRTRYPNVSRMEPLKACLSVSRSHAQPVHRALL